MKDFARKGYLLRHRSLGSRVLGVIGVIIISVVIGIVLSPFVVGL